jgi:hypothetical protein
MSVADTKDLFLILDVIIQPILKIIYLGWDNESLVSTNLSQSKSKKDL